MVEVFKTNVTDSKDGVMLIVKIHTLFDAYRANFDLEDCDRILRVESSDGEVCTAAIIDLLEKHQFFAEVLAEELLP